MRFHRFKEQGLSWRWWVYFARGTVNIELTLWSSFCHFSVQVDSEKWQVAVAFPPVALWIGVEAFGLWKPQRKHIFSWDDNREVWLTDEREFQIAVHHWTVWLTLWGRLHEWQTVDPWWIRGVSLNLPDFILGRSRFTERVVGEFDVTIPTPEGTYQGRATITHCTWKRPRWVAHSRTGTRVTIMNGIPFPGKGENSWDCGLDALWGYGCESTKPEAVIARGVQLALENRRRYGGSVEWKPPVEVG